MAKNVLILSGSPRKNGNSATLCQQFAKGGEEAGNKVELIYLRDKKIGYCIACYHCKKEGICRIQDDMAEILEKMDKADVIVLASPVYFYSINAQMKALIDRVVARWLQIKNKDFYYIITAAEEESLVKDCTLECMRGLAKCLKGSQEKGYIFGGGVYEPGKIKDTHFMQDAYDMGKRV